jgi:hypothetical protein
MNIAKAQKFPFHFDFGQKFKYGNSYINTLSGNDKLGYVSLRNPTYSMVNKHYLELYNSDFEPVKKLKLKLNFNGDKLKAWKNVVIKDRIFVLYWRKELTNGSLHICVQEFGRTTLEPKDNIKTLMVIENHQNLGDESGVDISISKDSSKIVLTSTRFNSKTEDFENHYYVFNSSFGKIFEKTVSLSKVRTVEQHEDVVVTNNGEVYAVMNIHEEGKNTFTTKIFKISQSEDIVSYDISETNIYPQALKIYDSDDQNIYCLGIYRNDTNSVSTHGTIFVQIDHVNNQIIKDINIPFDYKKIIGIDKIENASNALLEEKLAIKEIVMIDNQFVFLLEEFEEIFLEGGTSGMTEISYSYNDVIMCAYSLTGELNWIQRMDKKQSYPVMGEASQASFKSYVYKDKIYLAITIADEKMHGIDLYSIASDGQMNVSNLEKIDGEPFWIRPFGSLGIGGQLLLPIQIGEKYLRILRVYLD